MSSAKDVGISLWGGSEASLCSKLLPNLRERLLLLWCLFTRHPWPRTARLGNNNCPISLYRCGREIDTLFWHVLARLNPTLLAGFGCFHVDQLGCHVNKAVDGACVKASFTEISGFNGCCAIFVVSSPFYAILRAVECLLGKGAKNGYCGVDRFFVSATRVHESSTHFI